jgi:hypothetical protein
MPLQLLLKETNFAALNTIRNDISSVYVLQVIIKRVKKESKKGRMLSSPALLILYDNHIRRNPTILQETQNTDGFLHPKI